MNFLLGPHVHLATVGDDLVLLDIAADAYFCLAGAAAAIAVGPDGVTLEHCDPALLAALAEADLLIEGAAPPSAPRTAPPSPGTRDLSARRPPRPALTDLGRMGAAALRLYRHGHHGSLMRLLGAARAGATLATDPGEEAVIDLVERCEQIIPWVPFQGLCLFRSFLTLSVLRRRGAAISWVFGVQTWPFQAHCWLQRGELVLNDEAEHVSGYQPILVA